MRYPLLLWFLCLSALAQVHPVHRHPWGTLPAEVSTNDLVAYWRLEESTGTRYDSYTNHYDLAESGSPTNQPGPIDVGDGLRLNNTNSEYVWIADNTGLSAGSGVSFEIAFWFKARSLTIDHMILSKWTGNGEYMAYVNQFAPKKFQWVVRNAGDTAYVFNTNSTPETISTRTWYFADCWYDATNAVLCHGLTTAPNAYSSTTFTTNALAAGVRDSNGQFQLGNRQADSTYWDGTIDEVGFWKRLLTPGERATLYSAGAGKLMFATPPITNGVTPFIHITNAVTVHQYQTNLEYEIWTNLPPTDQGFTMPATSPVVGLANLASCQSLWCTNWTNLNIYPLVWTGSLGSNKWVLMHQGHDWTYNNVNFPAALQDFLNNGISVVGFVMPDGPDSNTSGGAADHNASMHPLSVFAGPAYVAVNYLYSIGHNHVYAAGISGGGWSAIFYGALDSRVRKSYAMGGSLPLFDPATPGARDWEMNIDSRGLAETYLDLYLLASSNGRTHKQIHYTADNCCFYEGAYNVGWDYDTTLASLSRRLWGAYNFIWYPKTTHQWYTDILDAEIIPEILADP